MREDVGDGSGGVCDAGLRHCTLHAARCTQDACSHHMEDLMPGHCPIELVLLCAPNIRRRCFGGGARVGVRRTNASRTLPEPSDEFISIFFATRAGRSMEVRSYGTIPREDRHRPGM